MDLPTLTVADIQSAGSAVSDLAAIIGRVQQGTATLDDATTVGSDVLTAIAFVDPPAAPTIALIKFCAALFIFGFETGLIKSDPLPETDAQTDLGRGGRRP